MANWWCESDPNSYGGTNNRIFGSEIVLNNIHAYGRSEIDFTSDPVRQTQGVGSYGISSVDTGNTLPLITVLNHYVESCGGEVRVDRSAYRECSNCQGTSQAVAYSGTPQTCGGHVYDSESNHKWRRPNGTELYRWTRLIQ